jgi:hypothetical protein
MAREFTVNVADHPGLLADIGEALGRVNVNIEAIQGMTHQGRAIVRLIVDKPGSAEQALSTAGIPFTTRDVVLVKVLNEPGTIGDVARVMSEAGINIEAVYVTINGRVVMAVDDIDGALQVAHGMAVV